MGCLGFMTIRHRLRLAGPSELQLWLRIRDRGPGVGLRLRQCSTYKFTRRPMRLAALVSVGFFTLGL
jgi:hypothetical protein